MTARELLEEMIRQEATGKKNEGYIKALSNLAEAVTVLERAENAQTQARERVTKALQEFRAYGVQR